MNVGELLEHVRSNTPLVHCITNYVTVNDCANILLACGGSPIMADDEGEAAEITALSTALVINIGTLNARTVESMELAGKAANRLGHPVVLDPVGAGASRLRTETAQRLLESVRFHVIRGNASEIRTLAQGAGLTRGVDADAADRVTGETIPQFARLAGELARKTSAVVALTGATDIVTDGKTAYAVHNGHSYLSRISGTGCMLSAVVGAFVGANPVKPLEAAVAAVCTMGLCGELAYQKIQSSGGGTGSFRIALMDAMSVLDGAVLEGGAKIAGIE